MKPPCAVPVCTLILLSPTRLPRSLQFGVEAVHVGVQLVDVGVLAADLADFAADRDREAAAAPGCG